MDNDIFNIPFNLDCSGISTSGISHLIYLYSLGYETIGVRLCNVWKDETYASEIVTYDVGSGSIGINQAISEQKIVNTEYFNIAGERVTSQWNGIIIRLDHLDDGSLRYSKVIAK